MKKERKKDVPKIVRYLEALIAYKRTHIRREQDRLRQLEELLEEVEGTRK